MYAPHHRKNEQHSVSGQSPTYGEDPKVSQAYTQHKLGVLLTTHCRQTACRPPQLKYVTSLRVEWHAAGIIAHDWMGCLSAFAALYCEKIVIDVGLWRLTSSKPDPTSEWADSPIASSLPLGHSDLNTVRRFQVERAYVGLTAHCRWTGCS